MLGLHRLGRALRVGRRHHLVVEDVAALGHRALDPGVADDDDRLQRVVVGHVLVDRWLDRRGPALAAGAVDGDQRLGLGEVHPLGDRLGREAAEDDVMRGADPGAGEHRDDDLGDHRQVDPDHVALLDAEVLERVGETLDVAVQVGVGDVALLPLLAAPVVGDAVAVAGLDVAVEALRRGVQSPVGEPLVEGRVGVVEALARLDVPVEQLLRLAPSTRPRGRRRPPRRSWVGPERIGPKSSGGSNFSTASISSSRCSRSMAQTYPRTRAENIVSTFGAPIGTKRVETIQLEACWVTCDKPFG